MWMLVRRCGELCVSHVRSPGLFTVQSHRRAGLDRRGQWRLTVELVKLNQAYPLLGLQCMMLFPRPWTVIFNSPQLSRSLVRVQNSDDVPGK